jgi:glutamate formiminotransferase/formiminotetrahydrofolate cyclodeaminase
MKIVECVPNFSEGTDSSTIEKIADAIRSTADASLLDIDPGIDTNRTVFTFVGNPEAVLEAAFRAIRVGTKLIDMLKHKGAHPRIGACDVCPFIPVAGVSMEECVKIAQALGKRVGEELNIPVYLYGSAALVPERKELSSIRQGEYEGLQEKLARPEWKPDFGPVRFDDNVKKTGAIVIGAREFLIAFNINLDTEDQTLADAIAKEIREKGKTVIDQKGKKQQVPGKFKACKAIGWYVEEYGRAQVSINLTNYHTTNMHHVFEAVQEEARKRGVKATGSQIVGLVPIRAMVDTGRYYIGKLGESHAATEEQLIEAAVSSLRLDELGPFIAPEKIIEYRVRNELLLTDMTVRDFTAEIASSSPAPGGGSVSAAAGSIASALVSMIGSLTAGNRRYKNAWGEAAQAALAAEALKDEFLQLIDDDKDAFLGILSAIKEKKSADDATKQAVCVPHTMMKLAKKLLLQLETACRIGNTNTLSEMAIAAHLLRTAIYGAFYNILMNVNWISDKRYIQGIIADAGLILDSSEKGIQRLIIDIENKLEQVSGVSVFRRR